MPTDAEQEAKKARALAAMQAAAAALPTAMDLRALKAACASARKLGVADADVDAAECTLARVAARRTEAESTLSAAAAPDPAVLEVMPLEEAIRVAREAGVAASAVKKASTKLTSVAANRGKSGAALRSLLAPSPPSVDIVALGVEIETARKWGVSHAEVTAAVAQLKESTRVQALEAMGAAAAHLPSSMDLMRLAALIEKARIAGVDESDVSAAEATHAQVAAVAG